MNVVDWITRQEIKTVVVFHAACPLQSVKVGVRDTDTGVVVWQWQWQWNLQSAPSQLVYPPRWSATVEFAVGRGLIWDTRTPRSELKYGVLNAQGEQVFPWPSEAGEAREDPCNHAHVIGFVVTCDKDVRLSPLPSTDNRSPAQRQENAAMAEKYHEMVRSFVGEEEGKEIDTAPSPILVDGTSPSHPVYVRVPFFSLVSYAQRLMALVQQHVHKLGPTLSNRIPAHYGETERVTSIWCDDGLTPVETQAMEIRRRFFCHSCLRGLILIHGLTIRLVEEDTKLEVTFRVPPEYLRDPDDARYGLRYTEPGTFAVEVAVLLEQHIKALEARTGTSFMLPKPEGAVRWSNSVQGGDVTARALELRRGLEDALDQGGQRIYDLQVVLWNDDKLLFSYCIIQGAPTQKEIDPVTHVQLNDSIPTPIRDDAPVVE